MTEPNYELPYYIKPCFSILKKQPKKEKEVGPFKKFMEMLNKVQVSIPFCEALEQMLVYAKFMKELLSGKHKLKYDENTALTKKCSASIQRKLPPKLTDPCRFTISCSICSLIIGNALYDLGTSINLMSLSIRRKLKCGEPKATKMTLPLVHRSITYPYVVLEDILVRVNGLMSSNNFVILYMLEDFEPLLILRRPFLATGKALIDVELGELTLRFHKEKVVFNGF